MNRLICCIVLLLSGKMAIGQEVIYSPYEKFDMRTGDFSVLGKIGDRLFTYRSTNEGFFLNAYNDSMERKATVMLDFFPKKINDVRFIPYHDQVIVLYQAYESGKIIQYAALLDAAARLKKGPLMLVDAKAGLFGSGKDYFSVAISDDKKSIFVYGTTLKSGILNFKGVWLDDQINITGKTEARFANENEVESGEGILANDGSFYLPVFTPSGPRNYAGQVWILEIGKNQKDFNPVELPLNSFYAASTYMKLDNVKNRLYIGGFYSDRKNGNYEGVLYAYLDLTEKSFKNYRILPFDETLRNATGERNKKKAFNNFIVRQMVIKKSGGFVLIAENFTMSTRNNTTGYGGYYSFYYGPFVTQTTREYRYDDIVALSYDEEAVPDWNSFIRKSQYSQEDGGIFSSYAMINTGGSLGFLFNDYNTNRSSIQLATIDGAGKQDIHSLAEGSNDDPDWLPRSGKQISAYEVVVPCLRKKQICFAKIVF